MPPHVPRVSYDQEIEQAKQIQGKAKLAVTNLFNEARLGNAVDISAVGPLVDEINQSIERNAGALLSIVRLKTVDDYTYMHSVAVCVLMTSLGKQMGLIGEELHQVGLAGLLHDVGKMGMPLEVLNKPGKLTDAEFTIMKNHPMQGWEILKKAQVSDAISLDVCLHHHEKMDGSGYPERISGDAITLYARMGAVCDVYDAITSERPYKHGWDPAESIKRMAEWRNGHFDETVFQAFVKTIGIYPAGSLVRLKSGRLAVITDQSDKSLLTPRSKCSLYKSKGPIKMEVIDLGRSHDGIGAGRCREVGFRFEKVMESNSPDVAIAVWLGLPIWFFRLSAPDMPCLRNAGAPRAAVCVIPLRRVATSFEHPMIATKPACTKSYKRSSAIWCVCRVSV